MKNKFQLLVEDLKRMYGTVRPFELANHLDIEVRYVPFKNNPKGMYTKIKGVPMILLSEQIEHQPERNFVLAHELYHFLEHEENAGYYILNDNARNKLENEANKFAITLLTELYIEENNELPNTVEDVSFKYGESFKENVEKLY